MKKVFSILLASILTLSITACGDNDQEKKEQQKQEQSQKNLDKLLS